jgi:two-component system, NtrC family, response regulator
MPGASILVIDDEEKLRQLLSRILELEGYHVFQAAGIEKGLKILQHEKDILLVISDVKLPDGNGLQLLEKIKASYPLCEVIIMTAYGTIQDGVKAMKLGAADYITKGDGDEQIIVAAERAVEKAKLHRRILHLESQLETRYGFENIIGSSKAISETIRLAKKVAPADSTVLLEGETGVGKELFAQAIHYSSPRSGKPFVAINCSAFPKDLLESEMFGHKKGAFTGAVADKKGLLDEAHEGTLFLDEMGEMSPDLQAKLLRVLETQTFTRVGDTKPHQVNVRIIAATNRDLKKESSEGNFRADLYYRLSVFNIVIPPLRERSGDIEALALHFLHVYAAKSKKRMQGMNAQFIEKLKQHDWKGNIRELKNVIERAVILTDEDTLDCESLPIEIATCVPSRQGIPGSLALEEIEKAHIRKVLLITKGNKTKAAELLGIGVATLYRKLHEFSLD